MKRVIGVVLISIWVALTLIALYYPSLLGVQLPVISFFRQLIYAIRALFGEDAFTITTILIGLTFLPLALSKPMYPFFKNLLGVELVIISYSLITYLSNPTKPIYLKGIVVEDLGNLATNLLKNETLVSITTYLVLAVGIYLILTSYKLTKSIIAHIIIGFVNFLSSIIEAIRNGLKSLKEYNNNYEEEYRYTSPSSASSTFGASSTFSASSASGTSSPSTASNASASSKVGTASKNINRDFIEITVIDTDSPIMNYEDESVTFRDTNTKQKSKSFDIFEKLPPSEEVIDTSAEKSEEFEEEIEKTTKDIEYEESKNARTEKPYFQTEEDEYFEEGKFSGKYPPPIDLLDPVEVDNISEEEEIKEIEERKRIIEETFAEFKINATIEGIVRGPVVTLYEIKPQPGTKINKIVNISDNLALNLATPRVRIVYPIPGKSVIGIEIPNKIRKIVRIRELITSREYRENRAKLPLVIGKDIHGKPIIEDLTQMPHLLIAGSTGSGKSVYVNSIITGLLYSKSPEELRFIMIDLKIVELKVYNGIPHLLTPVVTTPSTAKSVLEWLVNEMQDRYRKLEILGCRDIVQYNNKVSRLSDETLEKLPYIVLIIDEYADLMMTSPKETEDYITRLAAMSRAVGIHLIIATQRPSVDVVTGLIKANFPARVAFRVASKVDSRTILDTIGAEKLLGKGDLLFMSPSTPNIIRVQGAYISNEEVERVVEYLIKQDSPRYIEIPEQEIPNQYTDEEFLEEGEEFSDELYHEAIKIVVREKKASASYLQRRLRIGFNRAARMIDRMEEEGIVGPQQGSKPREILVDESFLERLGID